MGENRCLNAAGNDHDWDDTRDDYTVSTGRISVDTPRYECGAVRKQTFEYEGDACITADDGDVCEHSWGPAQDGFGRLVPGPDGKDRAATIRHCTKCCAIRQHIHVLISESISHASHDGHQDARLCRPA